MESRRARLGRLGGVLVVARLALFVSAQDCFLTSGEVATLFTSATNANHIESETQVIITSYEFLCCGNIIIWQAYVEPATTQLQGAYNISFQVWRPSQTVQQNGCYSKVGENNYTSVLFGDGGLVSETPAPSHILTVQPGDVMGYYTSSRSRRRGGIQLENSKNRESVWYHRIKVKKPLIQGTSDCPFPVGAETGRSLMSFTNAAPVLRAGVSSFPCPVSSTLSLPSSSFATLVLASNTSAPIQLTDTTPQLLPTPTYPPLGTPHPTAVPSMSEATPSGLPRTSSIAPTSLSVSLSSSLLPSRAPNTSSAALRTAAIASVAAVAGSGFLLASLCMLLLAMKLAKVQHNRRRTLAEIPSLVTEQQVNTSFVTLHGNEAYAPTSHSTDESTVPTLELYEPMSTPTEVGEPYTYVL